MGEMNDLLPDLAAPKKARKIRAPKHDFDDGNGRVFAHRHANGNGWVADTARVDASVKVASGCGVYGYARVTDQVELAGKAKIGDHARVMNQVKLSGNTIVRGSAIVRDTAQLSGNTFVSGQSHVSGDTTTNGRVYISDFALVHNTRCQGPARAYHVEIGNNARAFDCQLHGAVALFGMVVLQNSQLYNCKCVGAAIIVDSTINTSLENNLSGIMWRARRRQRGDSVTDENVPSLDGQRITVQGVVLNSRINMRACVVPENAYVLECTLNLFYQDLAQIFPEFPTGPMSGLNASSATQLPAYYARQTQPTTAMHAPGIPIIGSVGVVPPPDLRQRRIMRMEEATT